MFLCDPLSLGQLDLDLHCSREKSQYKKIVSGSCLLFLTLRHSLMHFCIRSVKKQYYCFYRRFPPKAAVQIAPLQYFFLIFYSFVGEVIWIFHKFLLPFLYPHEKRLWNFHTDSCKSSPMRNGMFWLKKYLNCADKKRSFVRETTISDEAQEQGRDVNKTKFEMSKPLLRVDNSTP